MSLELRATDRKSERDELTRCRFESLLTMREIQNNTKLILSQECTYSVSWKIQSIQYSVLSRSTVNCHMFSWMKRKPPTIPQMVWYVCMVNEWYVIERQGFVVNRQKHAETARSKLVRLKCKF